MQTTNDQIVLALANAGIKFNITAKGKGLKRENWECDGWLLELSHKNNTEYFDYFTGIGHRKVSKANLNWINSAKASGRYNPRMYAEEIAKYAEPVKPELCGVIHSLIMDSSAMYESFDNWCDNFGYDSDSLKAFNIYQACCENAKKLRKVMDNKTLETLQELLQDY